MALRHLFAVSLWMSLLTLHLYKKETELHLQTKVKWPLLESLEYKMSQGISNLLILILPDFG